MIERHTRPDLAPPTTLTSPLSTTATRLLFVLGAAEMRGLPMPMNVSLWESGRVTLQFWTRADVHTWAASLDVDHVDHTPLDGSDEARAQATWFEVPLTLLASVPRQPRSGVA